MQKGEARVRAAPWRGYDPHGIDTFWQSSAAGAFARKGLRLIQ